MKFKWFVIGWAVCFITACIAIDKIRTENPKPTMCDYKVAIIYRAQFKPGDEGDKDFTHSVASQVEWLRSHNYEILSMSLEYGFDMTQNLILRFAVIKYLEVKNVKEQKKGD